MLQMLRRGRRQARREIDALSARDLNDLGMSREDLYTIVGTRREVAERMTAMAARHGLAEDDLTIFRQDYALLLQTCAECHAAGECGLFLRDPAARADEAEFCPNHAEYVALGQTLA